MITWVWGGKEGGGDRGSRENVGRNVLLSMEARDLGEWREKAESLPPTIQESGPLTKEKALISFYLFFYLFAKLVSQFSFFLEQLVIWAALTRPQNWLDFSLLP